MAWQTLQYKLSSSAPLIMHNGQTADPTNKWARLLKEITSKKSKTDADYEEMARIEFLAALYMATDGPIIPNEVLDGMVLNAAKKSREGQLAKSAVFCLNHARFEYEGPRKADEMWQEEQFHFARLVRVTNARVVRMRAIFNDWWCIAKLNVETTLINPARVDEWMRVAGTQVGLCDWRPQYGRFTVERLAA
jgi:hypothetical protein